MCSAYQTNKFDQNYVSSKILSSVRQMTFKLSAMDCLEPKDVVGREGLRLTLRELTNETHE